MPPTTWHSEMVVTAGPRLEPPIQTRLRAALSAPRALLLAGAVAYVVARVASVVVADPVTGPDSKWYLVLDWSGRSRPWPVPAFYALWPSSTWRIGAQTAIAACAWLFAAWSIARLSSSKRLGIVTGGLVLVLGTTREVTWWDRAIHSESLSISVAVVGAAALVRYAAVRRVGWLYVAGAAFALLALIRSANAPIVGLAALCFLVAGVRGRRRPLLAVAGVLLIASLVAVVLSQRNERGVALGSPIARAELGTDTIDTETVNVMTVLAFRVYPNPERRAWFIEHGMPYIEPLNPDLLGNTELREWASDKGAATYLRYLISHPRWALTAPSLGEIDRMLAPKGMFPITNLVDHRPPRFSAPQWVSGQLMSNFAVLLGGAVVAAIAAWLVRSRPATVAVLILASTWPHVLVVWHGSTAELDRLSITAATLARVAILAAVAGTGADLLRVRRSFVRSTSGTASGDVQRADQTSSASDCPSLIESPVDAVAAIRS